MFGSLVYMSVWSNSISSVGFVVDLDDFCDADVIECARIIVWEK